MFQISQPSITSCDESETKSKETELPQENINPSAHCSLSHQKKKSVLLANENIFLENKADNTGQIQSKIQGTRNVYDLQLSPKNGNLIHGTAYTFLVRE
ncbi:hypothetical protein HNY73_010291 [Argiope bruennichi]|uniref:Uncharacterized protein n=1 Tax=Argiope bruennichi TaxID=94029 RepID=A0A8T0F5E2_ARGBR|nr:hypothetical protein HNY73_010291 [Argiope bruennichi]